MLFCSKKVGPTTNNSRNIIKNWLTCIGEFPAAGHGEAGEVRQGLRDVPHRDVRHLSTQKYLTTHKNITNCWPHLCVADTELAEELEPGLLV